MKNNENKKNDKIYYTIFTVILLISAIVITFALANKNEKEDSKELSYTELINKIDENAVEKIEMTVGSTSIKVKLKNQEEGNSTKYTGFYRISTGKSSSRKCDRFKTKPNKPIC